jgi:hypothetical protein
MIPHVLPELPPPKNPADWKRVYSELLLITDDSRYLEAVMKFLQDQSVTQGASQVNSDANS